MSKSGVVIPIAAPVPISEPLLLDIKGAARFLSCSVWAVRSLLWDKKIPYIKIGRKYLIDPADLRAFVQREKQRAA
jgi:excisionase family DNA binding protein